MVDRPIGTSQLSVLRALEALDQEAPTAVEITAHHNQPWHRHTSDAVRHSLKRLADRGLARQAGTSSANAACWRITDARSGAR